MPENAALFQAAFNPVALRAKRLKQVTGESMGADSCPRKYMVYMVCLRYAPVNQAGRT
jgi:hypothetical protein